MAENFYTIITKIGLAKIANAQLTAEKLDLATIVVGDGNGSYYNPTSDTTRLKKEVWRGPVGSIATDIENPNWIVVETVIPATVGGFTVREIGLLDVGGEMIAIGKYPETYKPVLADGSSKDLYIRMIIEVASTSAITLKVDPTIIIASRKYVDDRVKQASDSIKDGSLTLPSLETTNKTIPGAINEVKDGLSGHVEKAATTATAGHVKLSSAVTSSDETKAATPAAVKKINDSLVTLAGPGNTKTVKQLDDEITEVKNEAATHSAEKASKTEHGHVKIGSGINVVDGEISVSEMTATNVSTSQGPSVQETLDTLKSDTDNKINTVRDAIVSKGGKVAGSPPTANQLLDGLDSLPLGGMDYPNGWSLSLGTFNRVMALDSLDNYYVVSYVSGSLRGQVYNKSNTLIRTVTQTGIVGISPGGYFTGNGYYSVVAYDLNGTLLFPAITVSSSDWVMVFDKYIVSTNSSDATVEKHIRITDLLTGSTLSYIPVPATSTSDKVEMYINRKGNLVVLISTGQLPHRAYRIKPDLSVTSIINTYFTGAFMVTDYKYW